MKKRLLALALALTFLLPTLSAGAAEVTQPYMTWLTNTYQTGYYKPLAGTLMRVYSWPGYYGIMDWKTGEMVLPLERECVTWTDIGPDRALVTTGDKWGGPPTYHVLDTSTGQIIAQRWEPVQEDPAAHGGLIPIRSGGKQGYFSPSGAVLVPAEYDSISVVGKNDQYFLAKKDGKWGVFDRVGKVVFPFLFPNAWYAEDTGHIFALHGSYLGVAEQADYLAWSKYAGQTVAMGPAAGRETVTSVASPTLLNDREITLNAYLMKDENGGGSNYIKLRDVAALVSGTSCSFNVGWSAETGISLTSGQIYAPQGNELTGTPGTTRPFAFNSSTITLDGVPVPMNSYVIDENTYFRLRDLGNLFGFQVDWQDGRVILDTP